MAKMGKVHFLTSFMEYLLDQGIRTEDTYLSDISRFLRFLLQQASPADVEAFLAECGSAPSTQNRIRRSLRLFYRFAQDHLDLNFPAMAALPRATPASTSRRPQRGLTTTARDHGETVVELAEATTSLAGTP